MLAWQAVPFYTPGDVPDIAIRLIAAVVILIVTAINVYGVKAATQIQVWDEEIVVRLAFNGPDSWCWFVISSDILHCEQIAGADDSRRDGNLLPRCRFLFLESKFCSRSNGSFYNDISMYIKGFFYL